MDRRADLRRATRDPDALQDGGKGIMSEDFKQALFGFGFDFVQGRLDPCVHAGV
jgi:hypothetical protein